MIAIDKTHTLAVKKDGYVSDYPDHREWCKYCVHFGTQCGNPYWLCSESFPDIVNVSFCGHCDKFSSDKKINLLKYWVLKMEGFQFRNKVR